MTSPTKPYWHGNNLNKALIKFFPEYVLPKPYVTFDVRKFARAIGLSHECVYRWLRRGTLTPGYADRIIGLAARRRGSAAPKPTRDDLIPFLFA